MKQGDASPISGLVDAELKMEQSRFFLKQNMSGLFCDTPFALAIAYLLADFSTASHLYLWLATLFALLALRIFLSRRWLTKSCDAAQWHSIRNVLLLIWTLYGVVWASGPLLFMPADNIPIQFIILVILSLSVMSSLTVAGSFMPAYLLYLYPVMGSQFVWFVRQMDKQNLIIAALIAVFLFMLTLAARGLQASYLRNIRLRHDNDELLNDLSSFKDAIEHATDAIAIFSKDGVLEYANPALLELSGCARGELNGVSWNDLYSDIGQALDFFKGDKSMVGQPWRGKLHLHPKQGDEITVMSSFSPVINSTNGRVSHCIVIQRDVRQEEFVRRRMDRFQRAESLSVMAAGIAHDFNNLLTSIMGSSSLIDMALERGHESHRYCEQISEACERAASLCDQMLVYAGQGKSNIKQLDLVKVLQGMRSGLNANVHGTLDGRGKLVISVGDSLPMIMADEGQIRQLVTHLVVNATEAVHAKGDGGLIQVRLYPVELHQDEIGSMYAANNIAEGACICLEVSDNGEGMDKATLDRVFDPFFSTRFLGRGLGLPAVLGTVKGHGGALKLESQAGQGSVIKTYFPCVDSQGNLFHDTIEAYAESIVDWSGMGSVLVVDDDNALLMIASNMVKRTGFSAVCASNGAEAVELYQQHGGEIPIALVDWSMPDMDGEEVARELIQVNPEVKILLSSGYSEELVMQSIASDVAAHFIQKPYSFEQLKSKLREMING